MRFTDTGTRLRGVTAAGDYGNNAAIDWTEATLDKLDQLCEMQPLPPRITGAEDVVQQDRTVTRWNLFLPAGTDMTAKDRWRFKGGDYEVDGRIQAWRRGGREHHIEARLIRVEGG